MKVGIAIESFDSYRKKFAALYDAVKNMHETSPHQHRGHGLDHDVAVAQMAALIAPTPRIADSGWVAALIHSTDRLVEANEYAIQLRKYLDLLPANFFSDKEIEDVYLAVFEHDEKSPTHRCPTQEVLQDADKLINMQATVFIRAGQFRFDIPTVELAHLEKINPASTYHAPKSVMDGLKIMTSEYPELIYTQKGKELASRYVERLRDYEQQILEDYRLLNLIGVIL